MVMLRVRSKLRFGFSTFVRLEVRLALDLGLE